ncbi:MAG: signal peptidase I [archaeon]
MINNENNILKCVILTIFLGLIPFSLVKIYLTYDINFYFSIILIILSILSLVIIGYYNKKFYNELFSEEFKNSYKFELLDIIISVIIGVLLFYIMFLPLGENPFATVVSESMSPTINKGDFLFIQNIEEDEIDEIEKGDIIIFYTPDCHFENTSNTNNINLVIHRVVEINKEEEYFKTKGDANNHVDPWKVYFKEKNNKPYIIGKIVWNLPLGKI